MSVPTASQMRARRTNEPVPETVPEEAFVLALDALAGLLDREPRAVAQVVSGLVERHPDLAALVQDRLARAAMSSASDRLALECWRRRNGAPG